ncbi:unnamed protein product, partial [Prorocentrum cordatum]
MGDPDARQNMLAAEVKDGAACAEWKEHVGMHRGCGLLPAVAASRGSPQPVSGALQRYVSALNNGAGRSLGYLQGQRAVMLELRRQAAQVFHAWDDLAVLNFRITACMRARHRDHPDEWDPFEVLHACNMQALASPDNVPDAVRAWQDEPDGDAVAIVGCTDARRGGGASQEIHVRIPRGAAGAELDGRAFWTDTTLPRALRDQYAACNENANRRVEERPRVTPPPPRMELERDVARERRRAITAESASDPGASASGALAPPPPGHEPGAQEAGARKRRRAGATVGDSGKSRKGLVAAWSGGGCGDAAGCAADCAGSAIGSAAGGGGNAAGEKGKEKDPSGSVGDGAPPADAMQQAFYNVGVDAASKDPRRTREVLVAAAAASVRRHPPVPADPDDPAQPWSQALAEDMAVELPVVHCAFVGCTWRSEVEGELCGHVREVHGSVVLPIAELVHPADVDEERLPALIAALLGKAVRRARGGAGGAAKAIVFFSSKESVDFHRDLLLDARWPTPRARRRPADRRAGRHLGGGFVGLPRGGGSEDEDAMDEDEEEEAEGGGEAEGEGAPGGKIFAEIPLFKLHGSLDKEERAGHIRDFSLAASGVLLSTDAAARGLDFPEIDWIVQYDPPQRLEEYLHRVGRTARIGRTGNALVFLMPSEVGFLETLRCRGAGGRMRELPARQLMSLLGTSCGAPADFSRERDFQALLAASLTRHVAEAKQLARMARAAFLAASRSYRTFSKELHGCFPIKELHLGHLAASFALRDTPVEASAR